MVRELIKGKGEVVKSGPDKRLKAVPTHYTKCIHSSRGLGRTGLVIAGI